MPTLPESRIDLRGNRLPNETPSPRFLVIGPDPDTPLVGGVVTHVRSLRALRTFETSTFVDLGHVQGRIEPRGIARILGNLRDLRRTATHARYNGAIVNASIYDLSLVRTALICWALRGVPNTHVFYQGGLFEDLSWSARPPVLGLLRRAFKTVEGAYFLSVRQREGFESLFPGLPASMFLNYSHENTPLPPQDVKTGPLHVLFTGRVVREKGVFELLEAVASASRSGVPIRLTIAGEGGELGELKTCAASFPDADVSFPGFLRGDGLLGAYRNADVFALPTYHPEGLPFSIIEAVRAGLPIVCTRSGALGDVIRDGVNGLLVPPRDTAALTEALTTLAQNSEQRSRMSTENRALFTKRLNRDSADHYYQQLLCGTS